MAAEQVLQIFVIKDVHQVPVIQSGPPDRLLRNVESQRADQVQLTAGGRTSAGDIAAVLRDFRLYQYDMEHKTAAPSLRSINTKDIVPRRSGKFNCNV